MIVMRYSFQIKPGKYQEALELVKNGRDNVWSSTPSRIYTSNIGPLNTIVIETEYKDNTEREKVTGAIAATEAWGSFMVSWSKVISGEGKVELWTLE